MEEDLSDINKEPWQKKLNTSGLCSIKLLESFQLQRLLLAKIKVSKHLRAFTRPV